MVLRHLVCLKLALPPIYVYDNTYVIYGSGSHSFLAIWNMDFVISLIVRSYHSKNNGTFLVGLLAKEEYDIDI